MANPNARIFILNGDGIGERADAEAERYRVTRDFLARREASEIQAGAVAGATHWKVGATLR